MIRLSISAARQQAVLASDPYDKWVGPGSTAICEFHRDDQGFLIRFPGEADFAAAPGFDMVEAWPVPGVDHARVQRLFENSIVPVLGNYAGGLFLHGSAVEIGGRAVAFLGQSRSGKTTLAGALAKIGYSVMTEDVIDLESRDKGYRLRPIASGLRLFRDSAEYITGHAHCDIADDEKSAVTGALPFSRDPAPLGQVFILGSDPDASLSMRRLTMAEALAAVMPHSFILDVEDRARLKAHFERLADLVLQVDCFTLDYRRDYADLPMVIETILSAQHGGEQ